MLKPKELKKQPEYWIEIIQNNIFRALHAYMQEQNLNQSQLANRMGVSKGYVSQILNGNFNFSLSKLVDLSIFLGLYPNLSLVPFEEMESASQKKSLRTIKSSHRKANKEGKISMRTIVKP